MWTLAQNGEALQRRTLAAYLALVQEAPEWARRLVMLGASADAAPLALAVLAAGGAVLWTDAEETSLRACSTAGLIDFQVTTLSEALRILKNEIRKGRPVSVGVLDAGRRVWEEAVERGVQPQALLADVEQARSATTLLKRGARQLAVPEVVEVRESHADTWRQRKAADAALLEAVENLPGLARAAAERWLRAAPRLFPRSTVRCYAASWNASKDDR